MCVCVCCRCCPCCHPEWCETHQWHSFLRGCKGQNHFSRIFSLHLFCSSFFFITVTLILTGTSCSSVFKLFACHTWHVHHMKVFSDGSFCDFYVLFMSNQYSPFRPLPSSWLMQSWKRDDSILHCPTSERSLCRWLSRQDRNYNFGSSYCILS